MNADDKALPAVTGDVTRDAEAVCLHLDHEGLGVSGSDREWVARLLTAHGERAARAERERCLAWVAAFGRDEILDVRYLEGRIESGEHTPPPANGPSRVGYLGTPVDGGDGDSLGEDGGTPAPELTSPDGTGDAVREALNAWFLEWSPFPARVTTPLTLVALVKRLIKESQS